MLSPSFILTFWCCVEGVLIKGKDQDNDEDVNIMETSEDDPAEMKRKANMKGLVLERKK
jgi:hypothetical protein